MKRTFWFLAGAASTYGVLRKFDQTKENLSPEKLGSMAAGVAGSIFSGISKRCSDFIDDVRVAAKLREREIYDSVDPDQG